LQGDLLDGLGGARQHAVMHALAPHRIELRFGREFRLLPVVLHQLEGLGGRAVQLRHHLQRGARIRVQRVNQRLLNRYRAVERPYIAPCLERVAFGQMPHAQRGGLVHIHPVVHAQRYLRDEFAEFEVNGRVVGGVRAAQHNQHFDGVVGEVLRQLANLLLVQHGLLFGRRGEDDRLAEVAQVRVDGVRHRVHGRRLRLAHNHEALPAMLDQVARGDLRPLLLRLGQLALYRRLHGRAHHLRDFVQQARDLGWNGWADARRRSCP
jgi:hypothetical protein